MGELVRECGEYSEPQNEVHEALYLWFVLVHLTIVLSDLVCTYIFAVDQLCRSGPGPYSFLWFRCC